MFAAAKLPAGILVGLVAATSLLLAACSASSEDVNESCGAIAKDGAGDRIDKCVLEAQVQSQLTKKTGEQVPPINCPDELDAEVGAMTICTFTGAEGTFDVTVTVTSVDWGDMILDDGTQGNFVSGNAKFDLKVADEPNP